MLTAHNPIIFLRLHVSSTNVPTTKRLWATPSVLPGEPSRFASTADAPRIESPLPPKRTRRPQTEKDNGQPLVELPSGKRLHNYGKSPFLIGKSTINGNFQ